MRILETKVYTIDEHPNKDLCFNYIRENWHDLNQSSVDEFIKSLQELQQRIGGELKYSIGQFPSRGEYISFKNYDKDELARLIAIDCELTGVCWDYDVISALKKGNINGAIKSIHEDSAYVYSDEGLEELCICTGYEFNEQGKTI